MNLDLFFKIKMSFCFFSTVLKWIKWMFTFVVGVLENRLFFRDEHWCFALQQLLSEAWERKFLLNRSQLLRRATIKQTSHADAKKKKTVSARSFNTRCNTSAHIISPVPLAHFCLFVLFDQAVNISTAIKNSFGKISAALNEVSVLILTQI